MPIKFIINQRFFMMRREQRPTERYFSEHNSKFIDYSSKQLPMRSSKNKNSRIFTNKTGTSHINSSEIFSQPQIVSQQQVPKPKRGASVLRNSSKSKYAAESMGKFRKQFIKDSYINFQYETNPKKTTKEEEPIVNNAISFDQQIGVEELHYQMVKLHQNIKKMQYHT